MNTAGLSVGGLTEQNAADFPSAPANNGTPALNW